MGTIITIVIIAVLILAVTSKEETNSTEIGKTILYIILAIVFISYGLFSIMTFF